MMDFFVDATVDALHAPVAASTLYARRVRVHALNVSADKKVLLLSQFEITNPNPYTVGIGRFVQRSDGKLIAPATMDNITPQMHHGVYNISVIDNAPLPDAQYYVVVYAVSTAATPGAVVKIEQGYGFLQAATFE